MLLLIRRVSIVLLTIALTIGVLWPAFSQTSEYELKAVFLYNFTHFVTWPESAFPSADSAFQLCIIGQDPFGHFLDETVTSEKVGEHPIVVRRIQDLENSASCHMIFLSEKSPYTEEQILSVVRDHPVLVTGETPEFAEKGGTIAFHVQNRRIRLQVNLRAARQANLAISSKLLKLSDVIEEN
jgi:uncharacterized protein DUF4154